MNIEHCNCQVDRKLTINLSNFEIIIILKHPITFNHSINQHKPSIILLSDEE